MDEDRAPNESSNNSTSTNMVEFESNSNRSFLIRLIRRINSTIFVFNSTIRRILEENIGILRAVFHCTKTRIFAYCHGSVVSLTITHDFNLNRSLGRSLNGSTQGLFGSS